MTLTPAPESHAITPDAPWLGLLPFTEQTQRYFFGREAELRELFLRVRDNPLTVLYGQSGLGKTSLLGAGLLPKLRADRFQPVLLRLRYEREDPPPLVQFRRAVALACATPETPAEAWLARWGEASPWELLHHADLRPPQLVARPLVVVLDQFEEAFTLGAAQRGRDELLAFAEALADLAENRPPRALKDRLLEDLDLGTALDFGPAPLHLLVTLREDYLSHLEAWKAFFPSLMRNRMALHTLGGAQALEAVARPGRLEGRDLITDEVAHQIICRIARKPLGTPLDQIEAVPPLLSLLCDELNRARGTDPRITADLVEARHGDILHDFYARSFDGLPPAVRCLVEDRMVTVGGHRNPVAREDAEAELARAGVARPAEAIEALVDRRLLSAEERGGLQRLELTHDVLAPLVVESRDTRQERERIARAEAAQREAEAKAAKEAHEKRRLRVLALASAAAAGLACIGMAAGWLGMRAAERARKEAQEGRARAVAAEERARGDEQRALEALAEAERQKGIAQVQTRQAESATQAAVREKDRATQAEDQVHFQRALALLGEGHPDQAVAILGAMGRRRPLDRFATDRLMTLFTQRDQAVPLTLVAHGDGVVAAAFSPDGTRLATASKDGTARVWNAATGAALTAPLRHAREVRSVAFSPDGARLATSSLDGTARVWDAATGEPVTEPMRHGDPVHSAAFSPDGKRLVTASDDATARVWDASTGKPVTKPLSHGGWVHSAVFSPDGRRVLTASADWNAQVWDARTGAEVGGPLHHENAVQSAAYSPDGRWVLTTCADNTARLWNPSNGKAVGEPMRHAEAIASAAFSRDGKRLVTACADRAARVWDARTGKPFGEALRHGDKVRSAAFSPDGRRIVTAASDRTARVWDARSGRPLTEPLPHDQAVLGAAFSPDGTRILTASEDRTSRVWDVRPAPPSTDPLQHAKRVQAVVFSPDGAWLATASSDKTARIWDARTGKPRTPPLPHGHAVQAAAFTPDGTRLATVTEDRTLRLWDARTGVPLTEPLAAGKRILAFALSPEATRFAVATADKNLRVGSLLTGKPATEPVPVEESVRSLAFSPDGRRLLVLSGAGTVRVRDSRTGLPLGPAMQQEAAVKLAVFSPDGRWVALVYEGRNARLFDALTGRPGPGAPLAHLKPLHALAFSPDGTRLVTASADATARVWDARTGKPLTEAMVHEEPVLSAAFSPDGTRILTTCDDHSARVWDAASGRPLTDPIAHEKPLVAAAFSPDGTRLATAADDRAARLWDLGLGLRHPPAWFLACCEAILGRRLNDHQVALPVADPIAELRELRARHLSPGDPRDPFVPWARRILHLDAPPRWPRALIPHRSTAPSQARPMVAAPPFHTGSFSLEEDLARLQVALREGLTEAAVVYQSRILEATSAHRCASRCGVASGNLNGNLVKLGWYGFVPEGVLSLAHCVRRLGNEARHLKRALAPVDADLGAASLEQWLDWFLERPAGPPLLRIPEGYRTLAHQVADQGDLGAAPVAPAALEASPSLPALLAEALLGQQRLDEAGRVLGASLARYPEDVRLRQLDALWLRRSGRLREALSRLKALHAEDPRDEETLGIYGGSLKAAWKAARQEGEAARADKALQQCHRLYQDGWKRSQRDMPKDPNLYLGINAAATALWTGQPARAAQDARDVLKVLDDRARALGATSGEVPLRHGFWDQATRVEALRLLGRPEEAEAALAALRAAHPERVGDLAVLTHQLEEHQAHLEPPPAGLP